MVHKSSRARAEAQYDLGLCSENSEGVEQHHAKAVKWYTNGQQSRGMHTHNAPWRHFYEGHSVAQNKQKAVEWPSKQQSRGVQMRSPI